MKLLKYLSLAILAGVAVGCSDGGPEPDAIAPGVYFPKYNSSAVRMNPFEESSVSFTADLCRTFNTVGTVVNFETTIEKQDLEQEGTVWGSAGADAAWFSIPSQVTFDNNYSKVSFDMTVLTDEMEFYQPYRITIKIVGDTQISLYGTNTYTFTFTKTQDAWVDLGMAYFADGWVMSRYQTSAGPCDPLDYAWQVPMQQNVGEPFMYRLVNPDNAAGMPINPTTSYDYSQGDVYLEINLENEEVPVILPQFNGIIDSDGTMTVCNIEGYLADQGASYADIEASLEPDERSVYEDGFLYIPTCYFFYDGDGPYTWTNGIMNGAIQWPDDPEGELSKRVEANNKADKKSEFVKKFNEFSRRK